VRGVVVLRKELEMEMFTEDFSEEQINDICEKFDCEVLWLNEEEKEYWDWKEEKKALEEVGEPFEGHRDDFVPYLFYGTVNDETTGFCDIRYYVDLTRKINCYFHEGAEGWNYFEHPGYNVPDDEDEKSSFLDYLELYRLGEAILAELCKQVPLPQSTL